MGDIKIKIDSEQRQTKSLSIEELTEQGLIDLGKRTIKMPVSSDEPCDRYWYREVQLHGEDNIDLSRIASGSAPLLYNHDPDQYIGIIEDAYLENGRLYQTQRFDTHALAEKVWQSVLSGVLKSVSIGYRIHEMEEFKDDDGYGIRVTKSEILETSIVTMPADPTVGVGKSIQLSTATTNTEVDPMPETIEKEQDTVDYRQIERERQGAINKYRDFMGESWAEAAIDDGMPIEAVRQQVLEKKDTITQNPVGVPELGMAEKEEKEYSLCKVIKHLSEGGKLESLGVEYEAHRALADAGIQQKNGGLLVPSRDLRVRKDFQIGDANTGASLLETELDAGNFIDLLRTMPYVYQAGGRMLTGLVGSLNIPRQTSATQAFWVAENGAITPSDFETDLVQFTPKTLGILSEVSRLMLLQATPDIEQLVRSDLLAVAAREVDRSALIGSGLSNEPTGIINQTGVAALPGATNGAAPTWASIVSFETEVATDNALMGSLAYMFNARTKGKLKTTVKEAGEARYLWDDTPSLTEGYGVVNGYRAYCTNQLPNNLTKGSGTDLSAAIFGNWSDFMTGMWGDFELAIDPYRNFATGLVGYRLFVTADHQVRHPESFAVATDLITTP